MLCGIVAYIILLLIDFLVSYKPKGGLNFYTACTPYFLCVFDYAVCSTASHLPPWTAPPSRLFFSLGAENLSLWSQCLQANAALVSEWHEIQGLTQKHWGH